MSGARRLGVLAVMVAVLVAAGLADRVARPPGASEGADITSQTPYAPPAAAASSAWFCVGATAGDKTVGDGTVVVANTTGAALEGTATVVAVGGMARTVALSVPAADRARLRLAEVAAGPWAAAVVELDGGGAVVELATSGPLGASVTPCASSASPSWHFAEGSTTKDAAMTLSVFNPFPDDAVVDFVFFTDEGTISPASLTGIAIAGRSLLAVNVGESVERRDGVAATVSARTGRLVAARMQTWDGSAGRKGASVALGSAASGLAWTFPEGFVAEGLAERFQIFNPNSAEAEVEIAFTLENGGAEPLTLRIPARSRLAFSATDDTRVPRGVAHAISVTATNGVGVVVERTVDAAAPADRRGTAITLGSRVEARRWAVAVAGTEPGVVELIVLWNRTGDPTQVSITALADGDELEPAGLAGLEIPARSRRAIVVGDSFQRPDTPLIITASRPVVVERDLFFRAPAPGTGGPPASSAMAMAIPLRESMGP